MKEGERIECEFKYVLIINIQIFYLLQFGGFI